MYRYRYRHIHTYIYILGLTFSLLSHEREHYIVILLYFGFPLNKLFSITNQRSFSFFYKAVHYSIV